MEAQDLVILDEEFLDPRGGINVSLVESEFIIEDVVELVEVDEFFRLFSLSVEEGSYSISVSSSTVVTSAMKKW